MAKQERGTYAIILAAGKGTRMGGDRAKVLYEVAGRPMLWWVVKACQEAGVQRCVIVVGYQAQQVQAALVGEQGCEFVQQAEQLGTAHATAVAQPAFDEAGEADVFVLAGDGPLIRGRTLARLLEMHRRANATATLATSVIDDPTGYGRIVRGRDGQFQAIIEQKDATEAQRAIREVNPSYYCFKVDALFKALAQVGNDNKQGEYYLTDVPGLLKQQGKSVMVVDAVPAEDVLSINTPQQLAQVDAMLRERVSASAGMEAE